MTRSLPSHPSFRFLQEQAKDVLKAHARANSSVCGTLRLLRRFHAATEADILAADIALHEVHFALAMDYGFSSWPAMKAHIEAMEVPSAVLPTRIEGDGEVRLVLNGVPKIGFHRRMCPFPAAVEASLEYLDRPESYDYLMGVSGAAFRRIWHHDDGGNVDLGYLQPEPFRLLFHAIGINYRVLPAADRSVLLDAVKRSIAAGKPVIAFGIIGPPEAGLVCGYDRGGEVLLGQSYFDFDNHPPEAPYYEREHWFQDMRKHLPEHGEPDPLGMIVLEGFRPRPEQRDILRTSLEWAIDLARISRRANLPNHICGLAACYAWADALEVDADYQNVQPMNVDPEDTISPRSSIEVRAMVHGDQARMLFERAHAAGFLRSMSKYAPEAAENLREAAKQFDEIAKTEVWPWSARHYMDAQVHQGLQNHEMRHRLAGNIRRAADMETQAIQLLEQARDLMHQAE